jgi:hypothetical protein
MDFSILSYILNRSTHCNWIIGVYIILASTVLITLYATANMFVKDRPLENPLTDPINPPRMQPTYIMGIYS